MLCKFFKEKSEPPIEHYKLYENILHMKCVTWIAFISMLKCVYKIMKWLCDITYDAIYNEMMNIMNAMKFDENGTMCILYSWEERGSAIHC